MAITAQQVKELRTKSGAGILDCKKALTETDGDIAKAIDWLREKGIAKAAKKSDRIAAEGLCEIKINGNNAVVFELNSETDFVAKNENFLALLDKVGNALVSANVTTVEDALKVVLDGQTIEEVLTAATATIGEKITLRRLVNVTKDSSETFGAYKHAGGRIACVTVLANDVPEVAKDIAMHVAAINPAYLEEASISADAVEKEKAALIAEVQNDDKMKNKPMEVIEKNIIPGRIAKWKKEICLLDQPFVKDPDLTVAKYVAGKKSAVLNFIRLEVGEGIEKAENNFAEEVMSQVNK